MVKFGQNLIMKENLQNISEEIKKTMWTDNKIYKHASAAEVKPAFEVKKGKENHNEAVQQLMLKSKTNREILEKIGNVYFSRPVSSEDIKNFQDFKKELINEYFDDRILSKKRNLAMLSSTLSDIVDSQELEQIKNNTNLKDISEFKNSKLLDAVKKHRNTLLMAADYKMLQNTDKLNLLRFLDNEEKKKRGVMDINDMCYDLTKVQLNNSNNSNVQRGAVNYNDIGFSLFVDQNLNNNADNFGYNKNNSLQNKNSSQNNSNMNLKKGDSDLFVSRLVMFEDFRHFVNNRKLTDDQILLYFRQNEDFNKAAELYFNELYGTSTIKITYIFPNKSVHKQEFSLVASPEELFMFVYTHNPDAIDPKLYKIDNTQIIFDPINDKFIGGLCLPQNTILNVKF